MAQKQSDKVLAFGDKFLNGASQISNFKTQKAPYDKSYNSQIVGVNTKFADNLVPNGDNGTEDIQKSIIEKFNIPESVEEDDNNYYVFKINGAYYCKQQNGDFKLYDKVMVYIPNGDWSRMYLDYPTGGRTVAVSSGVFIPFMQSEDPAEKAELKDGDYWIKTQDDEETFIALYKRNNNDWELVTDSEEQTSEMTIGNGVFVTVK